MLAGAEPCSKFEKVKELGIRVVDETALRKTV
jgi:NAD-dependent DNA ligase